MLGMEVMELPQSKRVFQIFLLAKNTCTLQFRVNYRKLNAVSVQD